MSATLSMSRKEALTEKLAESLTGPLRHLA